MNKSALRKAYLEKRLLLTDDEVAAKSKAIKELLFSRLMMHRYDRVHCYLPVKERNEVDTSYILDTLHADFPVSVYVPKIEPDGILTHHLYEKDTALELNKWNVPEPVNEGVSSSDFFNTDDDILVIVPLLAYDKSGNRIGYGKGYYDRFLSLKTESTLTVGLSFFEPEEHIPDTEETDIPLEYVFTPKRVWGFN
ncbi:5-formyltetrahydrofolate cyclo-ligase [Jiulongibacter sediminis]|jgi:5-formyltetrahydrofolate cyclo-ligase|uniref:5-formyltetrahydrofolate cyclo-ligase n=1 Tax=Jiulongibacter sediminis TaxID=1605367 RepID=UPI0026ED0C45|nr:5-formyltetrahydrofolate cyclo-ligase [Jiulongibacter sediminis]